MTSTTGNIFPVQISEGVVLDSTRDARYVEIKTAAALRLFRKISVLQPNFVANELGLYSLMSISNDLKARFAGFGSLKHPFSSRKNGCTWNPKGKLILGVSEIYTCPIEYDGEECPDSFYGDCLERIFGGGNDVRDFLSTPEGSAVLQELLHAVYVGLGNGLSEIIHFANHPAIETANTNGSYLVSETEWDDFYDQQTSITCAGFATIMDGLKTEGLTNYSYVIPGASFTGDNFTGDIDALLTTLVSKAKPELKSMINNGINVGGGVKRFPVILMSGSLFRAYKEYLKTQYAGIQGAWNYQLTKEDGTGKLMPGVLHYEGCPVIQWDESENFDTIVGGTRHRLAIVAPGNFGIATDVANLDQFGGLGLRLLQRLDAPYKGKVYMNTTLRIGSGLGDTNLAVYASA